MVGWGVLATGDAEAVKFTSTIQTKRFTIERMVDGFVVPVVEGIHAYLMLVVQTVDDDCVLVRTRKPVGRP